MIDLCSRQARLLYDKSQASDQELVPDYALVTILTLRMFEDKTMI